MRASSLRRKRGLLRTRVCRHSATVHSRRIWAYNTAEIDCRLSASALCLTTLSCDDRAESGTPLVRPRWP